MRSKNFLSAALAALAISVFICSCQKGSETEDGTQGRILLKFNGNPRELSKVSMEMPDTNEFLLTIKEESGKTIFDGIYCDLPEAITVNPGSYQIFVRSADYDSPGFSQPQYGDRQCIIVPPGKDVSVSLECAQINSGIRLDISPDFLTEYPRGVLFLKSDGYKIMYGYSERKIAYFNPGTVSLILNNDGSEKTLLTRELEAREVLTLKISVVASSKTGNSLKISVDTSRVWSSETFVIGDGDSKGTDSDNALTVSQARESSGREDVWVNGSIAGGDLTSTSASYSGPFKSSSNLLLASRSQTSSRDYCISVQLPAGKIREILNLVSNPDMLGREVCLNGDIVESYFGIPGLKNVSDFVLK